MLLIDQQYAFLLQFVTNVVRLLVTSLLTNLVTASNHLDNVGLFHLARLRQMGVNQVQSIVNVFQTELLGHLITILSQLVLAICYALAHLLVHFVVIVFVLYTNLIEQLLYLIA